MDRFMCGFGLGVWIMSISLISETGLGWLTFFIGIAMLILGFFAPSRSFK